MKAPSTSSTLARWGLLVTTGVMGLGLVATSLAGYLGAREASSDLVRSRSHDLLRIAKRSMGWGDDELPARLTATFDDLTDNSVRFMAIVDPRGRVLTSAGDTALDAGNLAAAARRLMPNHPEWDGDRVRTAMHLGRGFGPMRRRRGPPPWPGQSILVLEFEPATAQALESRALLALVVGSLVALLLLVAAAVFWRLSTRSARLERELARKERLATLGEMSAVLGHEIKNPLTSLKGHAQLALEKIGPDEPARRGVEQVVREALRLETLTKQVLDFARTDEVAPAPKSPANLVDEAVDQVPTEGNDRVLVDTSNAPLTWNLDATRMRQVLVNLVSNALQASPPDEDVEIDVETTAGQLVFEVRDRGPGIPEAERARIFEPFVTGRVRGTGLGLAVAKRIVDRHDGNIEALDNPPGGTIMRVTIPPCSAGG